MSNSDELISIIVPIYKVEKYLEKCIESIINQTYSKLEIILIDDGSPDACGEICDEFAKKDSRIKVVHKKNGGLSDARNTGIQNATGEFFLFVDSDDYISHAMVEILYKTIKKHDADMVVCGYYEVSSNGVVNVRKFTIKNGEEVLNGVEATERLLYSLEPEMVVAWNKMERRNLWNDIEFPVNKQHEDDFTSYQLMYKASQVVLINEPLYYYLQRGDGIIGSGFSLKSLHKIEAYESACVFFKDKNKNLYERSINLVLIMNKRCCDELIASDYLEKNSILKRLKKIGRKFYLKNFYKIKRGVKYHVKLISFYFFGGIGSKR